MFHVLNCANLILPLSKYCSNLYRTEIRSTFSTWSSRKGMKPIRYCTSSGFFYKKIKWKWKSLSFLWVCCQHMWCFCHVDLREKN